MNVITVPPPPPEQPRSKAPLIAAVAAGSILGAGNIYLLARTSHLDNQLRELRTAVKSEIVTLQNESLALNTKNAQAFAEIHTRLDENGLKTAKATTEAAAAARRYSEQLARKLNDQQLRLQEQQAEQRAIFSAQLGEMRQFADEAQTKMSGLVTDVTSVKSEVAGTRTELDRTLADLRSVRGDLGIQSGLIATNSRELAALRAIGERDYFEFQLSKSKTPTRVADIHIQLKKVDTKRNKFTMEVIADDKRVEKKDRTINEPVQFYVNKSRMPYEIVVNEVQPNKIIGYLATPKAKASLAATALRR